MRLFALLFLTASPAAAWEFSTRPLCTLTHAEEGVAVELTYDPRGPEYSIQLTLPGGAWRDAPVFGMAFSPGGPSISTPYHQLDGPRLTVRDRGFGNVLDGLQYNTLALAVLGDRKVRFGLEGAAEPVQAFRACTEGAGAV